MVIFEVEDESTRRGTGGFGVISAWEQLGPYEPVWEASSGHSGVTEVGWETHEGDVAVEGVVLDNEILGARYALKFTQLKMSRKGRNGPCRKRMHRRVRCSVQSHP